METHAEIRGVIKFLTRATPPTPDRRPLPSPANVLVPAAGGPMVAYAVKAPLGDVLKRLAEQYAGQANISQDERTHSIIVRAPVDVQAEIRGILNFLDRTGNTGPSGLEQLGLGRPFDQRQLEAAKRRLALSQAKNEAERQAARTNLRQLLADVFAEDMQAREKQAQEIEARLRKLRQQYQEREKVKDQIIDLQLKVLERDAAGLGFPRSGSTGGPSDDPMIRSGLPSRSVPATMLGQADPAPGRTAVPAPASHGGIGYGGEGTRPTLSQTIREETRRMLQGIWRCVTAKAEGKDYPAEDVSHWELQFQVDNDEVTVSYIGDDLKQHGTVGKLTIDLSLSPPRFYIDLNVAGWRDAVRLTGLARIDRGRLQVSRLGGTFLVHRKFDQEPSVLDFRRPSSGKSGDVRHDATPNKRVARATSVPATDASDLLPARDILAFKPDQPGVQYDQPADDEVESCRVVLEAGAAWSLLSREGVLLRRFEDTNRDGKVDVWRYYKAGNETYRDVDTDHDGRVDAGNRPQIGTRASLDK